MKPTDQTPLKQSSEPLHPPLTQEEKEELEWLAMAEAQIKRSAGNLGRESPVWKEYESGRKKALGS
jgi:predicted component of type VI protein secretion system